MNTADRLLALKRDFLVPCVYHFYRHPPIAYTRLRIIREIGVPTSVKRGDFVYVLSKEGRVVLIRIKKKEIKDA